MSDQQQPPIDPSNMSEEELRAAYEAQLEEQLRTLRVEDVVVQTIVTLVNLGGRIVFLRAAVARGSHQRGGRKRATRAAPDCACMRTPWRCLYQLGVAERLSRHFLCGWR